MCTVYIEQVHPLPCIPLFSLPSLSLFSVWWDFHYAIKVTLSLKIKKAINILLENLAWLLALIVTPFPTYTYTVETWH
jgi:hypothetical protein